MAELEALLKLRESVIGAWREVFGSMLDTLVRLRAVFDMTPWPMWPCTRLMLCRVLEAFSVESIGCEIEPLNRRLLEVVGVDSLSITRGSSLPFPLSCFGTMPLRGRMGVR